MAGIEVNDGGEGLVDVSEKISGQMDWGDGEDLTGEGGDATDEVNVCIHEIGQLCKPGRAEERAI